MVLSSDANCQTSDKLTIGGSPGNPDIIICDDNSNNHGKFNIFVQGSKNFFQRKIKLWSNI